MRTFNEYPMWLFFSFFLLLSWGAFRCRWYRSPQLDNLHLKPHPFISPLKKCQFSGNTRDRVLFSSIYNYSTCWFCDQIFKEKQFTLCRNLHLCTYCLRGDSYTRKKLFFIKYYRIIHFASSLCTMYFRFIQCIKRTVNSDNNTLQLQRK